MFAATPPLQSLKILVLLAMTEGIGYVRGRAEEGMQIEFIHIERAYIQAEARREVYVELPPEGREEGMNVCKDEEGHVRREEGGAKLGDHILISA